MSQRYKGAVISATPPTTSTTSAPGAWTLQQQMQAQGAGTWPFGGPFNYIEDVFSTWLYAGSNSGQTLTDGIDRTLGALDWFKVRNLAGENHILWDTARSGGLETNTTASQATVGRDKSTYITQNNGNVVLNFGGNGVFNASGYNYVKWTFREQAKFFDIVTFTSAASGNTTFNHNLGSTPGCVFIKNTQTSDPWIVYHRSVGNDAYLQLNSTAAQDPLTGAFSVSSTQVTISSSLMYTSQSYVAYVFAHNAGGFGLTGSDNVISCGSWTDSGSGTQTITLGYEPQFLIYKRTDSTSNWVTLDNMRGWPVVNAAGSTANLYPNLSNAESGGNYAGNGPTATGFTMPTLGGGTYIYIAIRRGPMKTPTTGTSVFSPVARAGTNSQTNVNSGFPPDLYVPLNRDHVYFANNPFFDRLRGLVYLNSNSTAIETDGTPFLVAYGQNGTTITNSGLNNAATTYIDYFFRRAPGFFDVVCYTGTGGNMTLNHNLGVVPEMMIVKKRSAAGGWTTYVAPLGNTSNLNLNTTGSVNTGTNAWQSTTPTSTVFYIDGSILPLGSSGDTFVAYLFASCPGVSKVGSYSGTGATQTISCGFAARFVLIKRTDSTGDWFVWDTARGMVAGTDPRLALNSTAAETNANWVYTDASGFQIVTTDATVNASGGSYIFLAIA